MTSKRLRLCSAVTMTGLTLSLMLSACGAQPAKNVTAQSAAPSQSASATTSPTALATPTATPSTEVPSTEVPARGRPPAAPAAPVQPALKTFTFPDGHISFSYPGSWSVRTQRGPGRRASLAPVEAIVSDRTGADLFSVSSGANGIGCSAGPVNRTVFDKAPVPGMREVDGTTPTFGFIVESSGGDNSYFMAVMTPATLRKGTSRRNARYSRWETAPRRAGSSSTSRSTPTRCQASRAAKRRNRGWPPGSTRSSRP